MKKIIYLGHLTYFILFFIAGFYSLERIIYTDSSFYLFKMIHFNSFNIEFNRYTSVFYEFFTYVAIQIGLPLKYLVIIFSINIVLFSYSAFLICVYFFKNYSCAFTILILNFLGIASSYFYPMSELSIGLVFSVFLFAWLVFYNKPNLNLITILVSLIILVLCFLSHPGIMPTVVFILTYYLIKSKAWKNINFYIITVIFICLAFLKTKQIQQNTYELNVISQLSDIKGFIKNIFHVYSVKFYFYKYFWVYLATNLFFVATFIQYIKAKKRLEGLFYLASCASIFLFYLFLYHLGESDVMMEKAFYPLTVFIMLPFFNELFFKNENKIILKIAILLIIVVTGLFRFVSQSAYYKERLAYIDKLYSNTNYSKNICYFDQEARDKLGIPWAIGVESLVYSTLKYPEHPKTFYFINEDQELNSGTMQNPNLFLCVSFWPNWELNSNSKKYFKIPDVPYKIMNPEIAKAFENKKQEKIKAMIEKIKKDSNWLQSVEMKAKEKGISLDSMLILDAKWVIENQK